MTAPHAVLDERGLVRHVTAFLADLAEQGRSPHTIAAYRNDLRQLLFHLADRCRDWRQVTPADLTAWVARMQAARYTPASIRRKAAAARAFCRWLVGTGALPADPARYLAAALPDPGQRPTAPADRAVAALLAAPTAPRDAPAAMRDDAIVRLLLATGIRASELCALDLADLERGSIRVRGRRGCRAVPLDPATEAVVRRYVADGRPCLATSDGGQDASALVLNRRGRRLGRQGLWVILARRAAAAGLPASLPPRALRRAFAARPETTRAYAPRRGRSAA
jgi:site-specific recombinase XerD